MGKLTKKETERLTAEQRETEQERVRKERAEQVASGTYRPRSTVFEDKRGKKREKAADREMQVPDDACGSRKDDL